MATTEVRVSPEDVRQAASQVHERIPEPSVAVIFGASGDLTRRKLIPALFELANCGSLASRFAIVGFARSAMSDGTFQNSAAGSARARSGVAETPN